jgi:hypothetical protein
VGLPAHRRRRDHLRRGHPRRRPRHRLRGRAGAPRRPRARSRARTSPGPTRRSCTSTPEFIIDTDAKGKVTAKGAKNHWYKRQRHLGLRPQQITSPLLFTQEQAQAQAEGLLQFYGRMIKTAQLTIPGCPTLRLGENFACYGELDGAHIDRTFYIDQVSHEYVEGGRQLHDVVSRLARPRSVGPEVGHHRDPEVRPGEALAAGRHPRPGRRRRRGGGGVGGARLRHDHRGRPGTASTRSRSSTSSSCRSRGHHMATGISPAGIAAANAPPRATTSGGRSDHQGPPSYRVGVGHVERLRHAVRRKRSPRSIARMFGIGYRSSGGAFNRTAYGFRFQLIHRSMIGGNHYNHVHFGVRRA